MRRIWLAAALLSALVTGALVWLYFVTTSPENIRRELAQRLEAEVKLSEAKRVWGWHPGVQIKNLELASPYFRLRAASTRLHLRPLPFLFGERELRSVWLQEAELMVMPEAWDRKSLALLRDVGARASWHLERVRIQRPAEPTPQEIFYFEQLLFTPVRGRAYEVAATGGPSSQAPRVLRLHGQADLESLFNPWRGRGELTVTLENFPLASWAGTTSPILLNGEVRLAATGRGSARATGDLSAHRVEGGRLAQFELAAVLSPEELQIERAQIDVAGLATTARGPVNGWLSGAPVFNLDVEVARTRWDASNARALASVWPGEISEAAAHVAGEFEASLHVRGRWPRPQVEGEARVHELRLALPPWPPLERISGTLRVRESTVELVDVHGRFLGAHTTFAGRAQRTALDITLSTEEFPLASLPLDAVLPDETRNLGGSLRLTIALSGSPEQLQVGGTATLTEAELDYGEPPLEVRALTGVVHFDTTRVEFSGFQGRLGPCAIRARGQTERPNWREALELEVESNDCELALLQQLAMRFVASPAAGTAEPYLAGLDGRADWRVRYAAPKWEAELELDGARWALPGLGQPLEQVRGRIEAEPSHLTVHQLAARLGESTLALAGRIESGEPPARWELDGKAVLYPAEAPLLLGPVARRLVLTEPVHVEARVAGNRDEGFACTATIKTPLAADGQKASASAPAAVELAALWKEGTLRLTSIRGTIGEAQFDAAGELRLRSRPQLTLAVRTPPATPLAPLLRYIRLPEGLSSAQGAVEVDLRLDGELGALNLEGQVVVSDLRLPEFLGEPVQIDGVVYPAADGLRLENVRVVQPRGTFDLSGIVRRQGESRLRVEGEWLNLDRFIESVEGGSGGDWLRRLTTYPARVELSVKKAQYLGVEFLDVQADIRQSEGMLALTTAPIGLSTGTVEAGLDVDWTREQVETHLALDQVPLEAILAVLSLEPTVRAPLTLRVDLRGPLGTSREFLQGAQGRAEFSMPHGRIRRGTLPERLFMLAKFLHEGFYGFSISFNWLFRALKPQSLRRFQAWTGEVSFGDERAQVDSTITAKIYTLRFTGPIDLASGEVQLHGEGVYRPGFEFNLSLKSLVNGIRRLFHLGGRKHGHEFEFDLSGNLRGRKSVNDFHFKD